MKTYVITGSTSGIGEKLTEFFSTDNIVFAGYRKPSDKYSDNPNIIPFYIDYDKPESIAQAIEFIKNRTDKIDTLLNVAGCVVAGAVEEIPIAKLKRQFDVNVFGAVELSQGLLPLLKSAQQPKIINISSMASYGIFPFISPYCSSKRALDIIFNSMMMETKSNLKVVSVKPGVIATPLWSKSVKENSDIIDSSTTYKKEAEYLKQNAYDNEKTGLSTEKVVSKIAKIDRLKNPKPSYCIGADAKLVSIVSRLPQSILNMIIKSKVKRLEH